MKQTLRMLTIIAACSFAFMGGCLEKITTVNFDYNVSDTFSTVAYANTGNQKFMEDLVTSGLEEELKAKGASLNNLDELTLKNASIEFETPGTQNFDAIDNFEVYLSTATLPEVKVAFKNPVPKGVSKVDLDVSSSDLSAYVKSPEFTVVVKGSNNAALPASKLRYSLGWNIKASVKK